jgi:hypothetical protein
VKLRNIHSARIPARKVRDYLLSSSHSVGRYKAGFFRSLGYDQANWAVLATDLGALLTGDAKQMDVTEFGTKYEIRGSITGPNGRSGNIICAWIILTGEDAPRFVTAYPED